MSANSSNVFINLITDYQSKGVNQAEQSLGGFESLAKKAAITFAGVFSAQKIMEFGKASVEAFMNDQKALRLLDQTLVNVGDGFDAMKTNEFVKNMSLATGVAKDQLIPAMQTLITYTHDASKSQDLLKLSTDIAAGTGKDLATVTTAVGKAYAGNVTGLSKLGVGLTAAQMKGKSFNEIQKELNKTFGGDAAVAADTYSGKVARLNNAFDEMKITVGEGLVNAFETLAGSGGSVDGAITNMQNFGYFLSGFISNTAHGFEVIGGFIAKIFDNPIVKWAVTHLTAFGAIGSLLKSAYDGAVQTGKMTDYNNKLKENQAILEETYKQQKDQAAKDKIIQDAAVAAKAKQLALDKASLQLKQASKVFDNQAAEIWAANAQAKDQSDKARLKLMQDQMDLQTAIDNKDSALATKLAATVQQDVANVQSMQASINSIKSPDNPLQSLLDALDQGKKTLDDMVAAFNILNSPITPDSSLAAQAAAVGTSVPAYAYNQIASSSSPTSLGSTPWADMPAPVVNVQLDGQALAANVSQWLQDISASGSSTATLSRNNNPVINP